MKDELQIILDGAEIPSVPKVLQKIIALSRDPSASSRQLEQLVRQEPGLVT
jgi:HD-like signal output (HDOD) protein